MFIATKRRFLFVHLLVFNAESLKPNVTISENVPSFSFAHIIFVRDVFFLPAK